MKMLDGTLKEKQQQQQLTIFYNGQIAVCEATELQVRAIILLANGENEERLGRPCSFSQQTYQVLQSPPITGPTVGLPLKRSLQRFLEKRKARNQAVYPYHRLQTLLR